ncbi:MAG: tRNA threonylcarbamoyladenosine dehydratase [Acidaminococcaceae bacterium]|nr:tRNA threonylcarbamoyladenosine dehydratase [Acidaminococcaceae bacterium]
MENWLARAEMLLGKEKIERLVAAHVMIFGLGGVGSYVAEALARSGVGYLTLIDGDVFALTNLNRQLGAEQRIKEINPLCKIKSFSEIYRVGDFEKYIADKTDFVADAIDDTKAKADLLAECYRHKIPVISAMGTGNKLDPSQLVLTDISKTSGCPLARSVRHELRKFKIEKGINVVYSTEKPIDTGSNMTGSMMFVPASAGILMASHIVKKIVGDK